MSFKKRYYLYIFIILYCAIFAKVTKAKDYYLLMFSTENCKYCDLAEQDFKDQPDILNQFKAAIRIKIEYNHTLTSDKEMLITEKLNIIPLKDNSFIKRLFEYTSDKTILRAAANTERYPTFTIVTLDKNNTFIGVGSSEGYPGKDGFKSNMKNIISNDNRVLFKKRFPIDY